MKSERLLNCIGQIDDKYIEEAKDIGNTKSRFIKTSISVAACICLVIGAITVPKLLNTVEPPIDIIEKYPPIDDPIDVIEEDPKTDNVSEKDPTQSTDSVNVPDDSTDPDVPKTEIQYIDGLQVLNISKSYSDMGYEGYDVYDISELGSNNPWNEAINLEYLPVFKNNHELNNRHSIVNPNTEKMTELMLDICTRLGLDSNTLEIKDYTDGKDPRYGIELEVKTDGITVNVFADYSIKITFDPAIDIPEDYNFNYHSSLNEMQKVATYIEDEYQALIDMESIQESVSSIGYNIYLQLSVDLYFYESAGTDLDRILNYNFNKIKFSPNDNGQLWIIWIYNTDISEKVADYPIITVEEAINLLEAEHYYTSAPRENFPGKEYIGKVELVYNTDYYNEFYMPYYKLYVELPPPDGAVNPNGLKNYGTYYVPAINPKWIAQEYVSYSDY